MRTIVTFLAAALRQSSTSSTPTRLSSLGTLPLSFVHQHQFHTSTTTTASTSTSTSTAMMMSTKTTTTKETNNTNDHEKAHADIDTMESTEHIYEHPLIDVDCNLIHSDLASLLPTTTSTTSASKTNSKYFNILHHPSTTQSNIRAMFVPSSTIDEAELFHDVLVQSAAADIDNAAAASSSSGTSTNNIDLRMSVGIHPYHTGREEIGPFDANDNANDSNTNTNSNSANIQHRIEALLKKDTHGSGSGNGSGTSTGHKYNHKYITCIGETGLDYSDGFPDKDEQLPWFEFQLQLAKRYNMPLFIHERLAFNDMVQLLDKVFSTLTPTSTCTSTTSSSSSSSSSSSTIQPKIIIHCFTGKREELKEYISRGYYISVSGYILKNGDGPNEINQCLKEGIIPMDKLMIETDAPYMGFKTCRESFYDIESVINDDFQTLKSKKRKSLYKGIYPNVPSSLPKVLDQVVQSLNDGRRERGENEFKKDFVASCLYKNSKNFFGF